MNPDFLEQEAESLTVTCGGVEPSCLSEETCDTLPPLLLQLNSLALRVYVPLVG